MTDNRKTGHPDDYIEKALLRAAKPQKFPFMTGRTVDDPDNFLHGVLGFAVGFGWLFARGLITSVIWTELVAASMDLPKLPISAACGLILVYGIVRGNWTVDKTDGMPYMDALKLVAVQTFALLMTSVVMMMLVKAFVPDAALF